MTDWMRLWPKYWQQNYSTSMEWDGHLNRLLDKGPVEIIDRYTASIAGVEVWIENWPYAYGRPYPMTGIMPTVATRKRLRDAVLAAALANALRAERK